MVVAPVDVAGPSSLEANHFPASEDGHAAGNTASDTTRDVVLPSVVLLPDPRAGRRHRPGGAARPHRGGLRPGRAASRTAHGSPRPQRRGRPQLAAGRALLVSESDRAGERVRDGRPVRAHPRARLRPRAHGERPCRSGRRRRDRGGAAAGPVHPRGRGGALRARGRRLPRRRTRLSLQRDRLPLRGAGGRPGPAPGQLHGDLGGLRGGVPALRRRPLAGPVPGGVHPRPQPLGARGGDRGGDATDLRRRGGLRLRDQQRGLGAQSPAGRALVSRRPQDRHVPARRARRGDDVHGEHPGGPPRAGRLALSPPGGLGDLPHSPRGAGSGRVPRRAPGALRHASGPAPLDGVRPRRLRRHLRGRGMERRRHPGRLRVEFPRPQSGHAARRGRPHRRGARRAGGAGRDLLRVRGRSPQLARPRGERRGRLVLPPRQLEPSLPVRPGDGRAEAADHLRRVECPRGAGGRRRCPHRALRRQRARGRGPLLPLPVPGRAGWRRRAAAHSRQRRPHHLALPRRRALRRHLVHPRDPARQRRARHGRAGRGGA